MSLDEQASMVLSFLYKNHRHVYPVGDIVEALSGKAASLGQSRVDQAIRLLVDHGLVASRNAHHPRSLQSLTGQKTLFYITQKGVVYCESNEDTSPMPLVLNGRIGGRYPHSARTKI